MRLSEPADPDGYYRIGRVRRLDPDEPPVRCACGDLAVDEDAEGPCCESCHGLPRCQWCGTRGRDDIEDVAGDRVCGPCRAAAS